MVAIQAMDPQGVWAMGSAELPEGRRENIGANARLIGSLFPAYWQLSLKVRQQAIGFSLHHCITFATKLLEFWAIEHGDLAAGVADRAYLLQLAGRFRDPFTTHAEHVGYQFLRHCQLVGRQPVQRQQQPTAQLLVH